MKISYFSLRPASEKILIKNGAEVSYAEMKNAYPLSRGEAKKANSKINEKIDGIEDIVYAITGQHIPVEERKTLRGIVSNCNKIGNNSAEREYLNSNKFVYGCLPYLLAGFKFSGEEGGISKDGINTKDNFIKVIQHVAKEKGLEISSFLCAHRGLRSIRPDALRENIKFSEAEKVINLISGVASNSAASKTIVNFYQPGNSFLSTYSIFPNILMQYVNSGDLANMFTSLEHHSKTFDEFISKKETSKIEFKSHILDNHSKKIIKTASRLYGKNWKQIVEIDPEITGQESQNPLLTDIICYMTKKEVERVMDFYGEKISIEKNLLEKNIEKAREVSRGNGLEKNVKKLIKTMEGTININGKSIYETLFYYLWGQSSAKKNGIGFGFEVDHDRYQAAAWNLGWNEINGTHESMASSSPLLFARKNQKPKDTNTLKDLSFRQFWR